MNNANRKSFARKGAMAAVMAVAAVASSAADASITLTSYTENATSFQAVYGFTQDITLLDGETTGLGDWTATLTQTYLPAVPLVSPAQYVFTWAGAHLATPHAGELPLLLADLGTCSINAGSLTGTFCDTTTYIPHLDVDPLLPLYEHVDTYRFWLELTNGGGYAYLTGTHGGVGEVPVPAAAWLFASGLAGMVTLGRRNRQSARG